MGRARAPRPHGELGAGGFDGTGSGGADALRAGRMVLAVGAGLVALGLVMVYSTSATLQAVGGGPHAAGLVRQMRWVVLGVAVGWIVSRLDERWLRRVARPLMGAALLLLVLTLILGPAVKGSRRWLVVGGLSLQASEVFKIAVLLYLADRLSARERAQAFGRPLPLLPLLAPVGLGALLVLIAPDLGTALFLIAEAVVLLGLAGLRPTRVLPLALTVLPLIVLFAYTRFPHVRSRLALYTEGAGTGTQVHEALVAIGSGGFWGRGLGEGAQKLGYFAEAHNDFIFAVIGEELGFIGAGLVILLFLVLAYQGTRVAMAAPDTFGALLAAGITAWLCIQAFVNIGVVVALFPVTGITLPFVSAGGSSLIISFAAVGILLSISRETVEQGSWNDAPADRGRRNRRAHLPGPGRRPVAERRAGSA